MTSRRVHGADAGAMMSDSGNSYDQIPYRSLTIPACHPDRLFVIGLLKGLQPAPVENCRVLELGCASGGNLIPMALQLPKSSFLGIDLSHRQIDDGKRRIGELGLENVSLRHLDIRALEPDAGSFDYVLAHGVYSWVGRPVREAMLQLAKASLADQGMAYISYNTLPGWHLRGIVRDAMRFHSQAFAGAQQQVDQARAMMGFLARHTTEEQPYGAILSREDSLISRFEDSYVFHDYLETENEAVYFHEFAAHASRHGLAILGDADPQEMSPERFPTEVGELLAEVSSGCIETEQYVDFLIGRHFRRSLLCHGDRAINHHPDLSSLELLHVTSRLSQQQSEENQLSTFVADDGTSVTTAQPCLVSALELLDEARPQSRWFPELLSHSRSRSTSTRDEATDRQSLTNLLFRCYVEGCLDLAPRRRPFNAQVGSRPVLAPLPLSQARGGSLALTNQNHDTIWVEEPVRAVAALLDGSQDRDEIGQDKTLRFLAWSALLLE